MPHVSKVVLELRGEGTATTWGLQKHTDVSPKKAHKRRSAPSIDPEVQVRTTER